MDKTPSFFKFFIYEYNKIDMEIPISFTASLEKPLPEKVVLRDRHNHVWSMKVVKVGESWYFVDGWDKFVQDNMLATCDLLVFKYYCKHVFNVKIYGPSATEKHAVRTSQLDLVPSGRQEHDSEDNDVINLDDDDDEDDSEDNDVINIDDDDDEDKDDSENNDVVNVDDDDDDDEMVPKRFRERKSQVVKGQPKNERASGSGDTADRHMGIYPKCYGMEIFEAGLAQRPTNPYFVTKIMPNRMTNLFIPADVIKDYDLDMEREIILVDPHGREFRPKKTKWQNGRWALSGEWRCLCKVNLVSLDDICICEFVTREGDRRMFLHISLIRAGR